jgi:hypothetical protein
MGAGVSKANSMGLFQIQKPTDATFLSNTNYLQVS